MPAFPQQLTAYSAASSQWTAGYTLTNDDSTPMDLSTATFEMVIRPNTSNTAQPATVVVTTTPGAQGYITITGNTALVVVEPAATALLGQGPWAYALWLNPGTPNATDLVSGTFFSQLVAVP